jgi:dTDP-D-glucose 4,6-dehydratase
MAARSWDSRVWVADNQKIYQGLGWQARYPFEAGFSATCDWFRNVGLQLPIYVTPAPANL